MNQTSGNIFVFRFLFSKIIFSISVILILVLLCVSNVNGQEKDANKIITKVSEGVYMLKEMVINTSKKTITIPCKVNMNEGLLEVVLCRKEGKVHESLLVTQITPVEFQTALLLLGFDPVNEVPDDRNLIDTHTQFQSIETPGDSVRLFLVISRDGKEIKKPIEYFIYDESKGVEIEKSTWLFRGAATHQSGHVIADPETTIIATYHDPMALMELNAQSKFNDELFYVNKSANLTTGEPVTLIIETVK